MAFQAQVGAWFAAHVITETPIGARFGLAVAVRPVDIQFESAAAVDDIVVGLEDRKNIYVQCKTTVSLERVPDSALGKTIAQLVSLHRSARAASIAAVILATSESASRNLDNLNDACRAFDFGESWESVHGRISVAQREALDLFKSHVDHAWRADVSSPAPSPAELASLARIFRICRFGDSQSSGDWREITARLSSGLYGNDVAAHAAAVELLDTVRRQIRTGAAGTKLGLLQSLRRGGHQDTKAPRFDGDLQALARYSDEERVRLKRHSQLGEGIPPITRDCLPSLVDAVRDGSLLVVGEPGAGKTGVLVALAEQMAPAGGPMLFLSVDRLAGITIESDLQRELGLQHPFLDALENWPGGAPGYLIIDALDATRGAASEGVMALFIERAMAKLQARWSIIASIRTFDLQNGARFRQLMKGTPPDPVYAEKQADLAAVRHFKIERLTEGELEKVAVASQALGDLMKGAPKSLHDLLRNIFNLSIAQDLLKDGLAADRIREISTQSQLIDAYEDQRVRDIGVKQAAKLTIERMVAKHRLTVPQVDVVHDRVVDLLRGGVLIAPGKDNLAFAHHVLFDHIASRFYFDREDLPSLIMQLSDHSAGLFLGPALRFTLERVWQEDSTGRPKFWALVYALAKTPELDSIVSSIALRAAASSVRTKDDVVALCSIVDLEPDKMISGLVLAKLARFAKIAFDGTQTGQEGVALAWATVAAVAAKHKAPEFADAVRFFLLILFEKADLEDADLLRIFGSASRAFLEYAWTQSVPILSTNGIRFVARSYASNVDASRALLQQIIEEPRFTQHAHEEAPWLAEGVRHIFPVDPDFAVKVYEVLFAREVPEDGKSWFGGAQSRILPLISNRRQDYEHARWHLARNLKPFFAANPRKAAEATIVATRFIASEGESSRYKLVEIRLLGGGQVMVLHDRYALMDWREEFRHGNEETVLKSFVEYLRTCSPALFDEVVAVAKSLHTGSEIWARLLGVGAERMDVTFESLWALAYSPKCLELEGLTFDAVGFVGAKYPAVPQKQRGEFEQAFLQYEGELSAERKRYWRSVQGRLLSTIPSAALQSDATRALLGELTAADDLRTNSPLMEYSGGSFEGVELTDVLIERSGANLKEGSNPEIRQVSSPLEVQVKAGAPKTAEEISALWVMVSDVIAKIDAVGAQAHETTVHAAWAAVCNAVEQIADSEAFKPGQENHPSIDAFVDLIVRLSTSPFPRGEVGEDDEERSLAYGNWDVRVYAASSAVIVCRKHPAALARCLPMLYTFLRDPVATVRLKVAQAINVLWNTARDDVWKLLSAVAEGERNVAVLSFFVAGPLGRLAQADPERIEALLSTVLSRLPTLTQSETRPRVGDIGEQAGGLMSLFYVKYKRPTAKQWLDEWWSDIVANQGFILPILASLQPVYVLTYGSKADSTPDAQGVQERAKGLLDAAIERAIAALDEAEPALRNGGSEEELKSMQQLYTAGDRLLDQCCMQLFFGSGASRESRQGHPDEEGTFEKARFFQDYEGTLKRIAIRGTPSTIHRMVDLYAFLAETAPDRVFDSLVTMLMGQAARDGYQYESLAADALVKLIRRYLADHLSAFSDADRRQRLIHVLELFSNAGWPDALQLLYELPDLLR
jgi:hypothetical protein